MKLTDEEIEREVRMTDKQYEEYKKAKEELEPVKNFLFWCGERGYTARLIPCSKRFWLGVRFGFVKDEMFKMPKELRERILITIKEYVEEKEKELREI